MSDLFRQVRGIKGMFNKDMFGPLDLLRNEAVSGIVRTPSQGLERPISKSWLFEVVDRSTSVVEKSFTLVMPPQSYVIKEAQRVSITKTFGNAFVDDYGSDNLQITLKGISGTSHAFPTFLTNNQPSSYNNQAGGSLSTRVNHSSGQTTYTGREAFYVFRNDILRYKDRANWDKKELRVYDLSDEQAYKCILLDFTLDRSADKPVHYYPYTISLFVYDRLDKHIPSGNIVNIIKDPITAVNNVVGVMDKIEKGYRQYHQIVNAVGMVKARALELRARWNSVLSSVSSTLTSPLDLAKNLVDACFTVFGAALDTYHEGKMVWDRYASCSEFARDALNNSLRVYGVQISQGWQLSKTLTIDTDAGVDTTTVSDSTTESSTGSSTGTVRDSDSVQFTFNGLRSYTIKANDSLQSIAMRELGDADLWMYIAGANSHIDFGQPLPPGTTIYIPVSAGINEDSAGYILAEDVVRNPYGQDIKIDENGKMAWVGAGDTGLISGIDNVLQAMNIRIHTEAGSIVSQSAFGITSQAGFAGTTMAISYVKMAVKACVLQDPRIVSCDVAAQLEADSIYIRCNLVLVGSNDTVSVDLTL